MTNKFRRILELVRKTDDTIIVTDPDGEDVFVVMDLDKYESFSLPSSEKTDEKDIWDVMKPANSDSKTWDMDEMDDEEIAQIEKQYQEFTNKQVEDVISENSPKISQNNEKNDDFGEEEFYLEPVE